MTDDRIGKYRLQRLLASGGMGEVFLARQEGPQGFSKPVVVKRILSNFARDAAFVQMFLNEARLAALLTHPNVVQIFELGKAQDTYFIAMEFIHGRTLRAVKTQLRSKGRPFPPAYAARIASAALHGLHYAHTLRGAKGELLNIVHRDMSPDNVMVGFDGSVKVLDFGIAKTSVNSATTAVGTVKGKYAYMSPETLDGQVVDGRTDVWSMGVMLYELLSGVRPFAAQEEGPLVRQITGTEPMPLSERAPEVPAALAAIVHLALQKDPNARYATAEEMALALEQFVTSAQVSLGDGETASFVKELFSDGPIDNPALATPSGEQAVPSTGLHFSEPDGNGKTQMSVILTAVNTPWRALGVGSLAALLLLGLGWGMAELGSRRAVSTTVANLPAAGAGVAVEDDPSAPLAEPVAAAAPEPAADLDAGTAVAPAAVVGAHAVGRGKVDLRVKPWAEVFEGKKSYGVTPMQPLDLPAGKHTLLLKNSDLSVAKTVNVKVPRDGTVTLRVDLRK